MIEEISKNDHEEETLEHFAGVEAQLTVDDPPLGLLPWNPREVLGLAQWSEPDLRFEDYPPSGHHGHVKRLLACTILLRNAGHIPLAAHLSEEEFFVETSASALLQLMRSAIGLGEEVPYLATRFLLWVYGAQTHPAFRPFAALSVLLMAITLEKVSSQDLSDVCAWVLFVEDQCRAVLGSRVESERWLIGLNSYEDQLWARNRWNDFARSILAQPNTRYSSETQKQLRDLSDRFYSNFGPS